MEKKSFYEQLSLNPAHGARRFSGLGILNTDKEILKYINEDAGLDQNKKRKLYSMLSSPEAMDYLLTGAAGAYIAHALASYTNMSKTSRILLSLAGYGIGNIIYNALVERKFTSYDPNTAVATIKI